MSLDAWTQLYMMQCKTLSIQIYISISSKGVNKEQFIVHMPIFNKQPEKQVNNFAVSGHLGYNIPEHVLKV